MSTKFRNKVTIPESVLSRTTHHLLSIDREDTDEDNYRLQVPISRYFTKAERRVLIIMQTVPQADLNDEKLLTDVPRCAFANALNYAEGYAAKILGKEILPYEVAVVNFNNRRHLHLPPEQRSQMEAVFAKRMHAIIERMNPTHILVSGDHAMRALFPSVHNVDITRGRIRSIKGRSVVSTVDFSRLMEKKGELANLLGFWCRNLANLLADKMPVDLSFIKPNPVYINEIEKFRKFTKLLMAAQEIGFDSETANLTVLNNEIYTLQFTLDTHPDRSFIIPMFHPKTPWVKEELDEIFGFFRKFFRARKPENIKTLIAVNGIFDLRVVMQEFKIPIIYHRVWEVSYGESGLDENTSMLSSIGEPTGGLAAILASFNNDFYQTASFSKGERATLRLVDINKDRPAQEYMAMDTQAAYHICQAQKYLAGLQTIGEKGTNFRKYFERHMLYQMSDTAHQCATLKKDGSYLSRAHLKKLNDPAESKVIQQMREITATLRAMPEVKEANKLLAKATGMKAKSLMDLGGGGGSEVFSFNKGDHLRTLFFKVMELEPVAQTDSGEDATGKALAEAYKDSIPLIDTYSDLQKIKTLFNTYCKGWLDKMTDDPDTRIDQAMRPDYRIVDTGRLASQKPSLQNIPSRGATAKIIKEAFEVPEGFISIRYDVNASEIRGLSYVANDDIFAAAFYVGLKLRQEYLLNPTPEKLKELKKKGDIHVANVLRLLGKEIEKDDPLRDAIKAIVFGLIYGKAAKTLGDDTKTAERNAIKAKLREARGDSSKIAALNKEMKALMDEDREEYAQKLIDKMFAEFVNSGKWIEATKKNAEVLYHVYSPIGRKRSLFAAMTGVSSIVSRQVRRGSNAPIQGFASEIATKAGRKIAVSYYTELPEICELLDIDFDDWELRFRFNRTVHDANYYSVPLAMTIPFIHICQYEATYGVEAQYAKEFNFKFTVPPEIELEVGYNDAYTEKWDWSIPNLLAGLEKTTRRRYPDEAKFKEVMRTILEPWRNKEMRKMLLSRFPLLNVDDPTIEKQIIAAIKPYFVKEAA